LDTVSLREAAQAVESRLPGPKCGFYLYRLSLAPDDLAFFDSMIENGKKATYIADVVAGDGGDLSDFTIRRHLNGRCACR
jgi:hypothetical protein